MFLPQVQSQYSPIRRIIIENLILQIKDDCITVYTDMMDQSTEVRQDVQHVLPFCIHLQQMFLHFMIAEPFVKWSVVQSRAGSVWIFQIRFDSVFNLKYSVSVFSILVFAHHHNARVSQCVKTLRRSR